MPKKSTEDALMNKETTGKTSLAQYITNINNLQRRGFRNREVGSIISFPFINTDGLRYLFLPFHRCQLATAQFSSTSVLATVENTVPPSINCTVSQPPWNTIRHSESATPPTDSQGNVTVVLISPWVLWPNSSSTKRLYLFKATFMTTNLLMESILFLQFIYAHRSNKKLNQTFSFLCLSLFIYYIYSHTNERTILE